MNVTVDNPLIEDQESGVRAEYLPVLDDKRVEFLALRPLEAQREPSVTINLTRNHRSQSRDVRDVGLTLTVGEIDGFIAALQRAKAFAEETPQNEPA